jgi:hypothetical protein
MRIRKDLTLTEELTEELTEDENRPFRQLAKLTDEMPRQLRGRAGACVCTRV